MAALTGGRSDGQHPGHRSFSLRWLPGVPGFGQHLQRDLPDGRAAGVDVGGEKLAGFWDLSTDQMLKNGGVFFIGRRDSFGFGEIESADYPDALGDFVMNSGHLQVAGGFDDLLVKAFVEGTDRRPVREALRGWGQPDTFEIFERRVRLH